ncbi:hypothetical protein CALVIDRAFT_532042 [Calocera viscosa TUFC12733]|uniref:Putative Zn2Cys6 domain-containing protein n=1 Tax=Calocera viscosa (strain TUFC12733) TaxID=1330018 RepID=A0A167FI29_CALVF|nr:hypothetical protein CALVIDRAFT_532042 [Calocera viscosa TUFC12733]
MDAENANTHVLSVGRSARAMAPDNPQLSKVDRQLDGLSSTQLDRSVNSCDPTTAARLRGSEGGLHPGGPGSDPGPGIGVPPPFNHLPKQITAGYVISPSTPAPANIEANGIINLFLLLEANPDDATSIVASHSTAGTNTSQSTYPRATLSHKINTSPPSYDELPPYQPVAPLVYQVNPQPVDISVQVQPARSNSEEEVALSKTSTYLSRRFEAGRQSGVAFAMTAPDIGLQCYEEGAKVLNVLKTWFNFLDFPSHSHYMPITNADTHQPVSKDQKDRDQPRSERMAVNSAIWFPSVMHPTLFLDMKRYGKANAKAGKPLFKRWHSPPLDDSVSEPPNRVSSQRRRPLLALPPPSPPRPFPDVSQLGDVRYPTDGMVATPVALYVPSFAGGKAPRQSSPTPTVPRTAPAPISPTQRPKVHPPLSISIPDSQASAVYSQLEPPTPSPALSPAPTPSPLPSPTIRTPTRPEPSNSPGYRRRLERYRTRMEAKSAQQSARWRRHLEQEKLRETSGEHGSVIESDADDRHSNEHTSSTDNEFLDGSSASDVWVPGSDVESQTSSDEESHKNEQDEDELQDELEDLAGSDEEIRDANGENDDEQSDDDDEQSEDDDEVEESDWDMDRQGELSEPESIVDSPVEKEEQELSQPVMDDGQSHHSEQGEVMSGSSPKPDSASTTYSQDILRALRYKERAAATLLDLSRNRPGSVDEAEFPEWERKLLRLNTYIVNWHREELTHENEKIKVAIRIVKEHVAGLQRPKREGGGGGGGDERPAKRPKLEDEDDDDYVVNVAHLSIAQRIRKFRCAQELIDDLESLPVIPIFSEDNWPDAALAVPERCQYLSVYFGLIKAGKALAWLQMRGPLATNIINIWTWHLEYNVEANFEHIKDIDFAFGETWSLCDLLRQTETGEVGSVADRYSHDLYSKRALRYMIQCTRPWPSFPNSGLPRVSAFMTLTKTHWADTIAHRSFWDSPPTHFFATSLFELMRYCQKWHLEYDLEHWPIPMYGFPAALLDRLGLELRNVAPPRNPFTDADLADLNAGGRAVTADEVYESIVKHTRHVLVKYDKNIKRVHAKHQRKSRRKLFGNIMPEELLGPPPNLEADAIPPIQTARLAGVVRVNKVFPHPFILAFGAHMCYNCRHRALDSRKGLQRCCRRIEGTGCNDCRRKGLSCLWRKPKKKKISVKDWDEPSRRPNNRKMQFTIDDVDNALADEYFNGEPEKDKGPLEQWEEIDDTDWLDVCSMEQAEKEERRAVNKLKGTASTENNTH